MKRLLSLFSVACMSMMTMACQSEESHNMTPIVGNADGNTLVVYYSYTNKTEEIVSDLCQQITADVIEIEPAEKGLNYAANNYRIGTEQLSKIKENPNNETSYPAIDPVSVDLSKYTTIIIATPLWWSQMASNMQTFLFKYGKEMKGKRIGLIVSSHSSGISGVETDAKRLIPEGSFMSKSLWINNTNHSRRKTLITQWLNDVKFFENGSDEKVSTMTISVNSHNLVVDLVDNSSTQALVNLLKQGEIKYEAHDYGGFEKVGDIGHTLPTNDQHITTETGDIILYQGRNLCIYYAENTWIFTRIGKIRNAAQLDLKEILGQGNVMVTLSLQGNASRIATPKVDSDTQLQAYSLNGIPIGVEPTAKGIYILNGKKMIRE